MSHKMEDCFPESPGERELRKSQVAALIEASSEIPPELKSELVKRAFSFIERKEELAHKSERLYSGQLGSTRWVIRDDQLSLTAALAPGAVAIATYSDSTPNDAKPAVLAVTLIWAMLTLGNKLKNKSATVDHDDYRVLMALKRIGPVTSIALTNFLNGVKIFGPGAWSEERTLNTLRKLKAITVRDGSVEAFVNEASDGRFSTNGI